LLMPFSPFPDATELPRGGSPAANTDLSPGGSTPVAAATLTGDSGNFKAMATVLGAAAAVEAATAVLLYCGDGIGPPSRRDVEEPLLRVGAATAGEGPTACSAAT
ncbi:hypothetical protein Vafri_15818, partial [Volvox africanus]